MLYVTLAYLMLLTALFNAVCLHNARVFSYFLPLTFALLFIQMLFVFMLCLRVIDAVCLFQVLLPIMYNAFNQLVFLILCSHRLF